MRIIPKDAPCVLDIDLVDVDLEVVFSDPRNGVHLLASDGESVVFLTFHVSQRSILRYLVKCLHFSLNRR